MQVAQCDILSNQDLQRLNAELGERVAELRTKPPVLSHGQVSSSSAWLFFFFVSLVLPACLMQRAPETGNSAFLVMKCEMFMRCMPFMTDRKVTRVELQKAQESLKELNQGTPAIVLDVEYRGRQ